MSKDKIIALVTALIIAIVFGIGLEYYSNHLKKFYDVTDVNYKKSISTGNVNVDNKLKKIEYCNVLVAKKNINLGDTLLSKNVKWVKWPIENTMKDFIMKKKNGLYVNPAITLESILGLVANNQIIAGSPIYVGMFINSRSLNKSNIKIRKGMRAMSVPLDKNSVKHNALKPGDIVEVYLPNKEHKISNVRILAFDNKIAKSKYAMALSQDMLNDINPDTVTLELTENQTDIMMQNLKGGGVYLVLMSEDDTDYEQLPLSKEIVRSKYKNVNMTANHNKVDGIKQNMYKEKEYDSKSHDEEDDDSKILIIKRDKAGFINPKENHESKIGVEL